MCRGHWFIVERLRRGERSENHAGAQTLSVFDKRVPSALHIRHIGFEGFDGVERFQHELHGRFSSPLLRSHRTVREEGSGTQTVRSKEQLVERAWRSFYFPLPSQRKLQQSHYIFVTINRGES